MVYSIHGGAGVGVGVGVCVGVCVGVGVCVCVSVGVGVIHGHSLSKAILPSPPVIIGYVELQTVTLPCTTVTVPPVTPNSEQQPDIV